MCHFLKQHHGVSCLTLVSRGKRPPGLIVNSPKMLLPRLSQGKYFITMIKIDYFCEGWEYASVHSVREAEKTKKKESEKKRIEAGAD